MKRLILLWLMATATAAAQAPISGPEEFIREPFDVLHYDADIDLTNAPARDMKGTCEITIRWADDPSTGPFYFHLRDLTIDKSFYDGAPIEVAAVGTPDSPTFHYQLEAPAGAKQGDTAIVRIEYSGTMTDEYGPGTWGGVSSSDNVLYAMGVGFKNNYVSTTEHWLPCYDHPSDKATFHGRFRVRTGMTVASNGLLKIEPEGDSILVYDWTHDYPCATYLLTFAVAPFVPLEFGNGSLPMVVYSQPRDTTATRKSFTLLPRMVEMLSERFIPYPFGRVGYVNTPQGSMEHQTMISFAASIAQRGDTVNSTAAHELAHQWFGDLVSPQDFRNAWLNESFATFCESLWAEELGGFAGYLKSQEATRSSYIGQITSTEGILPLYDFPREQPSSNYPATIYYKGAVVVGMLRYALGDSVFFGGLRRYLERYAYKDATTDSLRSVLEETSGRSLGWFFDQWVIGKGWPILNVGIARESQGDGLNRVQIHISQVQPQDYGIYTHLPVEIGFRSSQGTTYRMLDLVDADQTFTLDSIPDFTSINVNQGPSVRALLAVGKVSGVEETDRPTESRIIVAPNPTAGATSFAVHVIGMKDQSTIRYTLYDTSGAEILSGSTRSRDFSLPVRDIPSGTYLLHVGDRESGHEVRVVVTH